MGGISAEQTAELAASIQGAWSLFDLRGPDIPEAGRNMQGFLLVADTYLALEVHLDWVSKQEGLLDELFQSGIHHFTLDGLRIILSSMIGAYTSDDEVFALDYDQMHTERIYYIELDGDLLTLSRQDGTRMIFSRLRARQRTGTDFFGRPLPADEKKDAGR